MTNYVHILSSEPTTWSGGAVTSTVIASIAVILSLWGLLHSMWLGKQNGLPVLGYYYSFEKMDNNPLGYSIENDGIGPAYCLPPILYIDGNAIGPMTPEYEDAIKEVFVDLDIPVAFEVYTEKLCLSVGQREFLIWLTDESTDSISKVKSMDNRIDIIVCYRSLYSRKRRKLWIGGTDKELVFPRDIKFPRL